MINQYRTLLKSGVQEIVIDKSRFIGYAAPISNEEEAVAFIEEIKKKHRNATHNVPVYIVGERNEVQRYSDDGEPSGTAGVPILEVLKKEDLRNVVVVVTRYFGGIKLGTGGLVRAYTKGVRVALDAGKIILKKMYETMSVTVDYTQLGKVQNEILQHGYTIKETKYDEAVHFIVYVKLEDVSDFKKQIVEWTSSRCELNIVEKGYLTEIDGEIIIE
ncbi:protein of unknown function UPF0029 [Alkaliphilus metalliredigens QYMF]|uniref:Impact N-terminal domain-containing protein n=1 Tax=Alkaliphilus metalliredigens (strain QYMF) TaxID=293826 RepID=A6TQB9_ALKMQ|nr:YigZ family protein [Alkaliphilus metalliredigens]ABR48387.1 protein of unknown function UPF0029 [Alkaliphilus metalliredigens QYMF]